MEDEDGPFRRRPKESYDYNDGSFSTVTNLTQLSRETQRHLQLVYGNLTVTTLFAAASTYLFNRGIIPEPGVIAIVLLFACLVGTMFSANTARNSLARHGGLYGFGFAQGWLAGPLVRRVAMVSPETVLMTVIATVLIFGSFTMSAFYSPRRQYMYLGGILGSAMSIMMLAGLANMFLGSSMFASVELYLGLFIFSFYVLYDTQVIVERSEGGSRDPVLHAITLFTDFAAIFIRLLIILSKNRTDTDSPPRKRGGRKK